MIKPDQMVKDTGSQANRSEKELLSYDELKKVSGGYDYISFTPLFSMLSQRNMTLEQLVSEGVITAREAEKIRSNGNMNLSVIDRLCKRLHCQPADVVMFI